MSFYRAVAQYHRARAPHDPQSRFFAQALQNMGGFNLLSDLIRAKSVPIQRDEESQPPQDGTEGLLPD